MLHFHACALAVSPAGQVPTASGDWCHAGACTHASARLPTSHGSVCMLQVVNPAVGDGLSNALLVAAVLARMRLQPEEWAAMYAARPSRLSTVQVRGCLLARSAGNLLLGGSQLLVRALAAMQPIVSACLARRCGGGCR
jgi:hypothetical protein